MLGKKAETENVLIYIFVAVVAVLIVVIGYSVSAGITKQADKSRINDLKLKLNSDIESRQLDFGSVHTFSYAVPSGYDEVCFIGDADAIRSPTHPFSTQYPLVVDALDAGYNSFLVNKKGEFVILGTLDFLLDDSRPGVLCIPVEAGKISLVVRGSDLGVVVDERDRFAGQGVVIDVSSPGSFVTPDLAMRIDVPEGLVMTPAGDFITVNIIPTETLRSDPALEPQLAHYDLTNTVVYEFGPSGAELTPPLTAVYTYSPPNNPGELPVILHYHDDGGLEEVPVTKVDDYTLSFEIDEFSRVFSGDPLLPLSTSTANLKCVVDGTIQRVILENSQLNSMQQKTFECGTPTFRAIVLFLHRGGLSDQEIFDLVDDTGDTQATYNDYIKYSSSEDLYLLGYYSHPLDSLDSDISVLRAADRLKVLILGENLEVTGSIASIAGLSNLGVLDLGNTRVTGDVSELQTLTFEHLYLDKSDVFLTLTGEPQVSGHYFVNVDADYFIGLDSVTDTITADQLYFCENLLPDKRSAVEDQCTAFYPGGNADNHWSNHCFFTVPATRSHCANRNT